MAMDALEQAQGLATEQSPVGRGMAGAAAMPAGSVAGPGQ